MNPNKKTTKALSNPIYRPILQLVAAITLVFLIAVTLLVWTSWRNLNRIQPVHDHLEFMSQLQQLNTQFQDYQNAEKFTTPQLEAKQQDTLNKLETLINTASPLESSTLRILRAIHQDFNNKKFDNLEIEIFRNSIQTGLSNEIKLHDAILFEMSRSTKFEFFLSLIVSIVVILGLLIFLYFFRNQILLPLHNLNGFISLLAKREYVTMPMSDVEPLLQPLFLNYNNMVTRLSELEKEHVDRQKNLEENIRSATNVLIEQQQTLARSERLAILGEFVAGIAHELRNPLAGIQMGLINLRQDLETEAQQKQMDLIIAELARTAKILNDVLQQARHAPEQSVNFNMQELVSNLVTLARYQLPSNIDIDYAIDEGHFFLPQEGFRQALLNLIVNSAQAINGAGGKISIAIRQTNNHIIISVEDNGPGFPQKMLSTNIQPFVTWKENGTGLGMAMVRRFTQNLNGELILKNIEPHGALVTLKIPN